MAPLKRSHPNLSALRPISIIPISQEPLRSSIRQDLQ